MNKTENITELKKEMNVSELDVTILVNSCDRYEDAWIPFFNLFEIQWPNCPYNIVLNTESKCYCNSFLNVQTVNFNGRGSWSKRLKCVLEKIDTEFILYFLEDFFLEEPVNVESFNKALALMRDDSDIGYIGLKRNYSYTFKDPGKSEQNKEFLNKDDLVTCNRINSMTALWRKDWLISLLRLHETPWEFEKFGSIRSRRSDKKVLIINNTVSSPVFCYEVDVDYGMGIYGGKWLKRNRELFEKYNIEVNFDRLGIYEPKPKVEAKNETLTPSQKIREQLYKIKHCFKIMLRNARKFVRKMKSLL